MAFSKIIDGAYLVPMGNANAVLLNAGPELVLVDAGFPDKADRVLDAISNIGRKPTDLSSIPTTSAAPFP